MAQKARLSPSTRGALMRRIVQRVKAETPWFTEKSGYVFATLRRVLREELRRL